MVTSVQQEEVGVKGYGDGYKLPALLFELAPQTGYTHQLRVQLSSRGFGVIGDKQYVERIDMICLGLWLFLRHVVAIFQSSGALESPDLLPSCSMITFTLHITTTLIITILLIQIRRFPHDKAC